MSQQWPPAQPDGASSASSGPQDDQGTIVGRLQSGNTNSRPGLDAGATVGEARPCPRCNQTLDPGSRFCQSCGADVGELGSATVIEDEKPRPLWFAIALAWLILSAAALFFLYSQAILVAR
jgi:zinc-ribbon domain